MSSTTKTALLLGVRKSRMVSVAFNGTPTVKAVLEAAKIIDPTIDIRVPLIATVDGEDSLLTNSLLSFDSVRTNGLRIKGPVLDDLHVRFENTATVNRPATKPAFTPSGPTSKRLTEQEGDDDDDDDHEGDDEGVGEDQTSSAGSSGSHPSGHTSDSSSSVPNPIMQPITFPSKELKTLIYHIDQLRTQADQITCGSFGTTWRAHTYTAHSHLCGKCGEVKSVSNTSHTKSKCQKNVHKKFIALALNRPYCDPEELSAGCILCSRCGTLLPQLAKHSNAECARKLSHRIVAAFNPQPPTRAQYTANYK